MTAAKSIAEESSLPWASVIIPTYNRRDELRKTLSSLRVQTYKSTMEVLVLDDASQDGTREMVLEEFPEVRYTRLPSNKGQTYGRNVLAASARGDFLVLFEDDVRFLDKNAIAKAVAFFEERPEVALLVFNVETPATPGKPASTPPHYTHDHLAGASVIRRDAFFEAGGYRALFHSGSEETDLSLRLLAQGQLLFQVYDIRVFHHFIPEARPREWLRSVRYNTARNDLSIVVLQFPLRLVLPAILWKSLSHLRCGWRNGVTWAVVRALLAFCLRLPVLLRRRRPVSWTVLKRYYGLRRYRPTELEQVRRLDLLSWRDLFFPRHRNPCILAPKQESELLH